MMKAKRLTKKVKGVLNNIDRA